MENDERQILERARNGDISAFKELVERYRQTIYYFALDLVGNHHDAEDLSQEVFIKVYQSLHRFRGDAKLSSWLYRITVNTFIDRYRKKSRVEYPGNGIPDQFLMQDPEKSGPERHTESRLMQHHIERALHRLTGKERSIFVLRHYNDLSLKEIANVLNISVGTVKSMLFRAIQKLQKQLSFYHRELD